MRFAFEAKTLGNGCFHVALNLKVAKIYSERDGKGWFDSSAVKSR
jgi:hypothetical protein